MLVEVETDDRLVGLGESTSAHEVTGETQRSTVAVLENVVAPQLVGTDPLAVDAITSELKHLVDGAPGGHAAVEMAL